MQIVVNLTDEEAKVWEASVGESIEDWLANALRNKLRKRRDAIIEKTTINNPQKMSHADKVAFIENSDPADIKIYEVVSIDPEELLH